MPLPLIPTAITVGKTLFDIGKTIFKKDGFASKIAPTVAQTAASVMTNKTNRKYAEKQYNANMAAYEKQWDKQNAYNSPEAQMQRYKDAGLNPHLIYSQGSPGLAANVSTPQMNYEAVNPMNFGNVQNSMMYNSKLSNLDALTDQYRTNVAKQMIDIEYLDKSMEDRLKILAYQTRNTFNQGGFDTLKFQAWARRNGFDVESGTDSRGSWFTSSSYTKALDMTYKIMDQTLQNLYDTNETIDLNNAIKALEKQYMEHGLSPVSGGLIQQFGRILLRSGGLDSDWSWKPKWDGMLPGSNNYKY